MTEPDELARALISPPASEQQPGGEQDEEARAEQAEGHRRAGRPVEAGREFQRDELAEHGAAAAAEEHRRDVVAGGEQEA